MSKGKWLDADPEFMAVAQAEAQRLRRIGITATEACHLYGGNRPCGKASWADVERRVREIMRGRVKPTPRRVTFEPHFTDDARAAADVGSARRLMWA